MIKYIGGTALVAALLAWWTYLYFGWKVFSRTRESKSLRDVAAMARGFLHRPS